jgi:hypothetical protein
MASRTTSSLDLVSTVGATDFCNIVQTSTDVRINLDDYITGLLGLTSPATEVGAEVNDVVNVGGGIEIPTGSKTGSQVQIKTLIQGAGVTITDGGTTLTFTADLTSAYRTVRTEAGTTYTYALSDHGVYIRHTNASAITVTVPPNSSVAFPIGTELHGIQGGAGQVTIDNGSGVTINHSGAGADATTRAGNSGWSLIKVASPDTWDLHGDLTT